MESVNVYVQEDFYLNTSDGGGAFSSFKKKFDIAGNVTLAKKDRKKLKLTK